MRVRWTFERYLYLFVAMMLLVLVSSWLLTPRTQQSAGKAASERNPMRQSALYNDSPNLWRPEK